ncbi:MAG TPA: penicillin-binding protein 1B [Rudaea sp.]|nr:penicillin-binding protein 1B [Rudaea sp.]
MSASRFLSIWRVFWRVARVPFWLLLGLGAGFLGPYLVYLDAQVQSRFDDLSWTVPSRIFARSLNLRVGMPLSAQELELELDASRYVKTAQARSTGSYSRDGEHFIIVRRAFVDLDGREPARAISLSLNDDRVVALSDVVSKAALPQARLDPARIASLYGASQEERQVVALEQLPPLLVTGLQAVEDRDFKHHHGIDFGAIARAAWVDLTAGRVAQGGSTLTQQLVKNLFLDRGQRLSRKLNEALLAVLIEMHYGKHRILQAYVNEIFLGQRGDQAVHGFAAAAQFYFGRDVRTLSPADTALLVGMVRGPSLYDPRRNPTLALARRNRVLGEFYNTGLIDATTLAHARSAPLGVLPTSGLPRNRAPAFLDLVRAQLHRDYAPAQLQGAGLAIYTTLAPSTQTLAENALDDTLNRLGKRQPDLQGAMIVTDAHDAQVQAVIGSRDPGDGGFDRALDARRPVGSLVKPFVYLVALAQPQTWSLASLLDDAPVDMLQPNGSHWTPQNDDHEVHGKVLLIDALAHSYNLATVHLGMALGVDKVRGLLQSFGLNATINPNPSLLLGAVDLSPLDVAQLYQYFAADGHALPLRAVLGVIDAQGHPLKRYEVKPGSGDYVGAARLVSYAMQEVVRRGTARAIQTNGLAALQAAGKTGTSDSQRDSWFAGFTGSHLAVVWMGRDDNKPTGLWGASGALQAWIALFKTLPSMPLTLPMNGLEMTWIDPRNGQGTHSECEGARQLPFLAGYAPPATEHCVWQEIKSAFGGN